MSYEELLSEELHLHRVISDVADIASKGLLEELLRNIHFYYPCTYKEIQEIVKKD